MELLEFKHENDPARNRELFGLLGEYATNSVIWEKLGGTISSEPGRLWFIATDGETRHVVAFGSMRFGRGHGPASSIYTRLRREQTFPCWNIALSVPGKTVRHI